MILKWIGAAFVVVGCGSVGFQIAANHRRDERELRQIIGALDYMACELQYRLTPLPALCKQVAKEIPGKVGNIFCQLSFEMEAQNASDTQNCMAAVLAGATGLSVNIQQVMALLGNSIGRFDMDGQLQGLESVRSECRRRLTPLETDRDARLRSYKTLGLCAGAALAILFV